MAKNNCAACEDLRDYAPDFVVNGVTGNVCNSLMNDTGLNASASGTHTNCDDLKDANDCLVGNMVDEVDAYGECDWKDYARNLVSNLYNLIYALICSMCGLWKRLKKAECQIEKLAEGGISFRLGEEPTDGSYLVAGKGVSFLLPHSSTTHQNDIDINYIAGGFCIAQGTCKFFNSNFTDEKSVANFDNGSTVRTSTSRLGNSVWGQTGRPAKGGELIYEMRIKRSEYPYLKNLYTGRGTESNTGRFEVHFHVVHAGKYAYGQHGWCNSDTGEIDPQDVGYDKGHLVPEGYIYVQCRLHWADEMSGSGINYTPYGWIGIRMNASELECD